MNEERTTKVATMTATTVSKIYYSQQCLCCENTRRLPEGMTYCATPWVCDECKEAMSFLKDFMKSCDKAKEMLKEMENSCENIQPL